MPSTVWCYLFAVAALVFVPTTNALERVSITDGFALKLCIARTRTTIRLFKY